MSSTFSCQPVISIDTLIMFSETHRPLFTPEGEQLCNSHHNDRLLMPCGSNRTIDLELGYFPSHAWQVAYTSYRITGDAENTLSSVHSDHACASGSSRTVMEKAGKGKQRFQISFIRYKY